MDGQLDQKPVPAKCIRNVVQQVLFITSTIPSTHSGFPTLKIVEEWMEEWYT